MYKYSAKGKVNVLKHFPWPLCFQNAEFNSLCTVTEIRKYRLKTHGSGDLSASRIDDTSGKINFRFSSKEDGKHPLNELLCMIQRRANSEGIISYPAFRTPSKNLLVPGAGTQHTWWTFWERSLPPIPPYKDSGEKQDQSRRKELSCKVPAAN